MMTITSHEVTTVNMAGWEYCMNSLGPIQSVDEKSSYIIIRTYATDEQKSAVVVVESRNGRSVTLALSDALFSLIASLTLKVKKDQCTCSSQV
jgi:hypothetical protein